MASRSQRRRQHYEAAGYSVVEMGTVRAGETTTVDMSYQDNDDGTITATFDGIAGVWLFGDTLEHCAAFLKAATDLIAEDVREKQQAALRSGDMSGEFYTSLADLEKRHVQTRLIDGAYCTRVLGLPGVMLRCDSMESLGRAFSVFVRMGIGAYYSDQKTTHKKPPIIH